MQADERRSPAGLGVAVGHAEDDTFVQTQHVAEGARQAGQERQFVGARVPEDGCHAVTLQKLEGHIAYGRRRAHRSHANGGS